MFIIQCPWCGDRDQTEFSCHGEAHIERPKNTETMTDEQWGDYVFFRSNPKGMHRERWVHTHGCRRWFNALRDTATDEIFATYKVGDKQPEMPASATVGGANGTVTGNVATPDNTNGDQP